MEIYKSNNNATVKESTCSIRSNICSLCGDFHSTNCNEERHAETGFCTAHFNNFSTDKFSFSLDDSVKNYLNTQAIIF